MPPCAQIFEADSEEVQREWVKYTQKVDKKLEDALRHTVKKSLQVRAAGGAPHEGFRVQHPPSSRSRLPVPASQFPVPASQFPPGMKSSLVAHQAAPPRPQP